MPMFLRACACLRPRHRPCHHEVARQVVGVAAVLAFLLLLAWAWLRS